MLLLIRRLLVARSTMPFRAVVCCSTSSTGMPGNPLPDNRGRMMQAASAKEAAIRLLPSELFMLLPPKSPAGMGIRTGILQENLPDVAHALVETLLSRPDCRTFRDFCSAFTWPPLRHCVSKALLAKVDSQSEMISIFQRVKEADDTVIALQCLLDFAYIPLQGVFLYSDMDLEVILAYYDALACLLQKNKQILAFWQLNVLNRLLLEVRVHHNRLLAAHNECFKQSMVQVKEVSLTRADLWTYPLSWMSYPAHEALECLHRSTFKSDGIMENVVHVCWAYVVHGVTPPAFLAERLRELEAGGGVLFRRDLPLLWPAVDRIRKTEASLFSFPKPMIATSHPQVYDALKQLMPRGQFAVLNPFGGQITMIALYDRGTGDFLEFPWPPTFQMQFTKLESELLPGQPVALLVVQRNHVLRNGPGTSGVYAHQVKQLHMAGWQVVTVPETSLDESKPHESALELLNAFKANCFV